MPNEISAEHLKSWAAGFLDGEGSFLIGCKHYPDRPRKYRYAPELKVQLRADDEGAVHWLQEALGCRGYFYHRPSRRPSLFGNASHPTVEITWRSMRDLTSIVAVLDRYPLLGKKARDYVLWAEAVRVYTDTTQSVDARQEQLKNLRTGLQKEREYRKPSTLQDAQKELNEKGAVS